MAHRQGNTMFSGFCKLRITKAKLKIDIDVDIVASKIYFIINLIFIR